jgi:hypothetical protein
MRALHVKEWGGPLEPAEIAVPTPGRVLEAQDRVGALEGVHQMADLRGGDRQRHGRPRLARPRPSSSCPAAILCCATAFSASSSASPCADPMCSISRDPRREDHDLYRCRARRGLHCPHVRHQATLRAAPSAQLQLSQTAKPEVNALRYLPRSNSGPTRDEKPSHGSPEFARDTAWQKIRNRVAGTRLAAEKLGVS